MMPNTELLDRLVPLERGSFRDAVRLGVDIPMRYAECFVVMGDGGRVRLRDRSQLLGWSGPGNRQVFVFRAGERVVRVRTNAARTRAIREIEVWTEFRSRAASTGEDPQVAELGPGMHRFIAVDGSLLFLAPRRATAGDAARDAARRMIGQAGAARDFSPSPATANPN